MEKEAVAGGSPGKGSLVAEVCYTCQEGLEEQRSSARLSDSYEMKVLSPHIAENTTWSMFGPLKFKLLA